MSTTERVFWAVGGGIETPQGPLTMAESTEFLAIYTDQMRAALAAGDMDGLGRLAEVARQLLVARLEVYRWIRAELGASCAE